MLEIIFELICTGQIEFCAAFVVVQFVITVLRIYQTWEKIFESGYRIYKYIENWLSR